MIIECHHPHRLGEQTSGDFGDSVGDQKLTPVPSIVMSDGPDIMLS